jgi:hypothetical protein
MHLSNANGLNVPDEEVTLLPNSMTIAYHMSTLNVPT